MVSAAVGPGAWDPQIQVGFFTIGTIQQVKLIINPFVYFLILTLNKYIYIFFLIVKSLVDIFQEDLIKTLVYNNTVTQTLSKKNLQ